MKKNLCIILTLALLLPVLAGCQSAAPSGGLSPQSSQNNSGTTSQTGDSTVPQTNESTVPASGTVGTITKEDAKKIALDHAGLTAEQVTWLRTEPDRDDGTFHYDVEFHHDGFEYDYEIDAENGQILRSEKERD